MGTKLLLGILLLGLTGASQAALEGRLPITPGGMDYQAYYDTVLDITWLQDANLGGSMNWDDSVAWADNLLFGGFDDWRLASMDVNGDQGPTDTGIVDCSSATELECRDNELGYMFYQNLMGSLGDDLTGNQGLFTNIQVVHWSGTQLASSASFAWDFSFDGGTNRAGLSSLNIEGAWAVRSGDVAVTVGGSVSGMIGLPARCINQTTGQEVSISLGGATIWDCIASGLLVSAGDTVLQLAAGPVNCAGCSVTGAITGLNGIIAECRNPTTGQFLSIPLGGSTSWDCTNAGFVAAPGNIVLQISRGTVAAATVTD